MTHALFSSQRLTPVLFENLRTYSYTLVLDEVLEVVMPVEISKDDMHMLFETGKIAANEEGIARWADSNYKGQFNHLKRKAESHSLIWYDQQLFLWLFPEDMFRAFEEAYVLTFLFEGSHMKYYLDIHHIGYSLHHIENGLMIDGVQDISLVSRHLASMIDIYDGNLNSIGNENNALSKTWYNRHKRDGKAKSVSLNAYNFLRHKCKALVDESLWTNFVEMKKSYPVRDYQKGFCPCNARATNEYRTRDCLAYLVNVYDNPFIVRWFQEHGAKLDQDAFALSQLLQWIWRSSIRDGKSIKIYIPSSRMRRLLENWLNSPSAGNDPAIMLETS